MAKLQQNHHPPTTTVAGDGNFNLWSSCRRKIIATMRCSGGMSRHRKTTKSPPVDIVNNDGSCKGPQKPDEKNLMLKEAVKRLQSGDLLRGAMEVRELAKGDSDARTNFRLIGAIPPLVTMLDSGDLCSQISALYALLNLGIGNDMNKFAIVEAGAVHKMLNLIESPIDGSFGSPNSDLTAAVIANFLGLSALDSNKSVIGSSGAITFIIKTLKSLIKDNTTDTSSQVIEDCLRAIYNLSILSSNVLLMIEVDGFIPFLLSMIGGDVDVSDRILLILTNVVSTPEGRHAISSACDAYTILVDVLSWMDSPNCQEKVAYILMVMAYKSNGDQQAMIDAGIMSSLLELTLLGSTLAQKRSSRILEILRIKKGKQVSKNIGATISEPLCGSSDRTESMNSSSGFSNTNAVKNLVEQSLLSNMRKIMKRANLQQEFVSFAHLNPSVSVSSHSSSKSLPF